MAARNEIVPTKVPASAISRLRALKFGKDIERLVTPGMITAYTTWLTSVAAKAAADWPKRTGKSARELAGAARVRGASLDSIRGYFLVAPQISANEYGAKIVPRNAKKLAIPILDGLYPNGAPKRLRPESWRSLGSFIYKSRKTKQTYIAYKSKTDGKLRILYVLVDKVKLKELRIIRNNYDMMLPELYAAFTLVMQDAIVQVYNQQFMDALNSIDSGLRMRKVPSVIPTADLHAERLTPKY